MSRTPLAQVAGVFLRLGLAGFGGPAAHVALMEREIVVRRGWLTREAFLDLLAAANLLPGPNSTELAIHIGRERAGKAGLVVGGLAFIVPPALLTGLLAWAYVRWGSLPPVLAAFDGMKPVVLAIVAIAVVRLGRSALRDWVLAAVAIGAAALALLGVGELPALLLSGAAGAGARSIVRRGTTTAVPVDAIFLVMLKIGSVLYGSGYVLLAFLRTEVVGRGWLTQTQLLDAVAAGQITPGPLFTAATFVGYLLHGVPGAVAATGGIFLPAFLFVAVSGAVLPAVRRSRAARAALDGVVAGSVALMAVVCWQLGADAVRGAGAAALAVASGLLLWRGVGAPWLLAAGALLGLVLT